MVTISVISGFLGAGKTTLIRQLLKEKYWGESPILVENDYGALGMDQLMLKEYGIQVQDMTAGCICCSLMGNFIIALEELVKEKSPDHIIIEPSGVGKLSEILQGLKDLTIPWQLGPVITVVDCSRFVYNDLYVEEYFWDQIGSAGYVYLNKLEKVKENNRKRIRNRIMDKTSSCQILECQSFEGLKEVLDLAQGVTQVHQGKMRGIGKSKVQKKPVAGKKLPKWDMESIGETRPSSEWSTVTLTLPEGADMDGVQSMLEKLEQEGSCGRILRAKGILYAHGDYSFFNYVPGLFHSEPCLVTDEHEAKQLEEQKNRIVFIGSGLKEEELRKKGTGV